MGFGKCLCVRVVDRAVNLAALFARLALLIVNVEVLDEQPWLFTDSSVLVLIVAVYLLDHILVLHIDRY